jgi:hypothetical protein
MMQVNDRVKHSGYAIRPKRDYWLAQGNHSAKQRAKEWLDRFEAERGTVVELLDGKFAKGVRVLWDNGAQSDCLPYMVEVAE